MVDRGSRILAHIPLSVFKVSHVAMFVGNVRVCNLKSS